MLELLRDIMNEKSLCRVATMKVAPLAAGLAVALAIATQVSARDSQLPNAVQPDAQLLTVSNCDDSGPGSLRDVVAHAGPGGTVDLAPLATLCTTAATLTLSTGEIPIMQHDLMLLGPSDKTVTISAGGASRVFNHSGAGLLTIENLTVSDGYYVAGSVANGGCVYTSGNASLVRSVVENCAVSTTGMGGIAQGGAVFAAQSVGLTSSTVTGSRIDASVVGIKRGAGVYAQDVTAKYSTIDGNVIPPSVGNGGGLYAKNSATIIASTISNNTAPQWGGGIYSSGSVTLSNSTLSGNTANYGGGAIESRYDAYLHNSTIAFNSSGVASNYLYAKSSIFSNNGTDDIIQAPAIVVGTDNLVMHASFTLPMGFSVSSADPLLTLLQYNGGMTKTHALKAGSAAIGVGNNDAMAETDQRGVGYPRETSAPTGARTDIGAMEYGDTIFVHGFERIGIP